MHRLERLVTDERRKSKASRSLDCYNSRRNKATAKRVDLLYDLATVVANARWAAALRIAAPERRWKTVLEALNISALNDR